MTTEIEIRPASQGLATEFSKPSQPIGYAQKLTNYFINLDGNAEKRCGLTLRNKIEDQITSTNSTDPWRVIHEHIKKNGDSIFFATQPVAPQDSGTVSENGQFVIKFDEAVGAWEAVQIVGEPPEPFTSPILWVMALTQFQEFNASSYNNNYYTRDVQAFQFGERSVFFAKNMRPYYFDEGVGKLYQLNSVLAAGKCAVGTSVATLKDADVSDWINQTQVAVNDLIWNVTKNAWAIITSVGTSVLEHTNINSSVFPVTAQRGQYLGATNVNYPHYSGNPQTTGDVYEIWDMVENPFLPLYDDSTQLDNVLVAASGSFGGTIRVSSNVLTLANTVLRPGDYVYNTTRNYVARIAGIRNTSGNAGIEVITDINEFSHVISEAQSGDTFIFLKSPVPVAGFGHVNYGRAYLGDARTPNRVVISGPGDVRDYTTYQKTLETTQIDFSNAQPEGETLLQMKTFLRYVVLAGKAKIYVQEGINPISDTSAVATDVQPVGLFTQGVVGPHSLANIGSEMLYLSRDGLRKFNISDILAVETDNVSEVIKTELRERLTDISLDTDSIQVIHYPRRNWVMIKIGTVIYNFNYTPIIGTDATGNTALARQNYGTWSKFVGRLAECDSFYLRQNGDMVATFFASGDGRTRFYDFDKGATTDGEQIPTSVSAPSEIISTEYETAWFGPGKGQQMHVRYVRMFSDSNQPTDFNIRLISDLGDERIDDNITVSATGGSVPIGSWVVGTNPIGGVNQTTYSKHPLRGRSDYMKLNVQTSSRGSHTITNFILYGNIYETR